MAKRKLYTFGKFSQKGWGLSLILAIFLVFSLYSVSAVLDQAATEQQTGGSLEVVYPKQDYFQAHYPFVMNYQMFAVNGTNMANQTNCTITIYNQTGEMQYFDYTSIDAIGINHYYTAPIGLYDTTGKYSFFLACDAEKVKGFVSGQFEVSQFSPLVSNIGGAPLAAIIISPLILTIILLWGAVSITAKDAIGKPQDEGKGNDDIGFEQHYILKTVLFLLSFLPFFTSLHFAIVTVVQYYNFPQLQDAISGTVEWVGICYFVIVTYFIVYFIYRMIQWKNFEVGRYD